MQGSTLVPDDVPNGSEGMDGPSCGRVEGSEVELEPPGSRPGRPRRRVADGKGSNQHGHRISGELVERLGNGVLHGAMLGLLLGLAVAAVEGGADAYIPGPDVGPTRYPGIPAGNVEISLRFMLGLAGGGALTGLLIATFLPRILRRSNAWALALSAALLFGLSSIVLGGLPVVPPDPAFVPVIAIACAAGAFVLGLREFLFVPGDRQQLVAPASGEEAEARRGRWAPLAPVLGLFDRRRHARRAAIAQRPFPAGWGEVLESNVPLFGRLPAASRKRLQGRIQVFLDEKHMEGCGGLELTDEMRVTIAAQACLLELEVDPAWFPNARSVLVYPSTYQSADVRFIHDTEIYAGPRARLGESWKRGAVVVAWDAVAHGARDMGDGRNVVLHEFAHQLDQEAGGADGTPFLEGRSSLRVWTRVMKQHQNELRRALDEGQTTVLDDYGATNDAEFFAVATETFFERPHHLAAQYPELFDQLRAFYRQDPRDYHEPPQTDPVGPGGAEPDAPRGEPGGSTLGARGAVITPKSPA